MTFAAKPTLQVYVRRNSLMVMAHAGFINGARCVRMKQPLVGWDDCAEWSKLENVAIEGGGLLDANGDDWYVRCIHMITYFPSTK